MDYVVPRPIARYIRTNLDLVFDRTLVLPPEIDDLNEDSYQWMTVGRHPELEAEFHNGYHKTAAVYDKDTDKFTPEYVRRIFESAWQEFLTIDPDAKIVQIVRGLIGMSNTRGNMQDAWVHRDSFNLNRWSFLVHVKGTSGTTDFMDSTADPTVIKTIDFVPGQVTMFPSIYDHQGHLPTDTNDRYIMNFIMELDTKLNKQVFDTSPVMVKKAISSATDNTY